MSQALIKSFKDIPLNKKEISRYYTGFSNQTDSIDWETVKENLSVFLYNVVYAELPVKINDDELDFTDFKIKSKDLAKNLKNAEKVVLFLASVGIGVDRLIKKYSCSSPSTALLFQAVGAERVESLCDGFCKFLSEEYKCVFPRFSPGYGDLDIRVQKDIFSLLSPSKIGVTLGDDFLMSPLKSVTAFVGVSNGDNFSFQSKNKCNDCKKKDCIYKDE